MWIERSSSMSEEMNSAAPVPGGDSLSNSRTATSFNRRKFLGQAGAAAAVVTGAIASPSAAFGQSTRNGPVTPPSNNKRVVQSFADRLAAATREAAIPIPPHATNGDEARYPDKPGTYSKGLLQAGYGRVDLNAFATFKTALNR
jgi:hypothetical protein